MGFGAQCLGLLGILDLECSTFRWEPTGLGFRGLGFRGKPGQRAHFGGSRQGSGLVFGTRMCEGSGFGFLGLGLTSLGCGSASEDSRVWISVRGRMGLVLRVPGGLGFAFSWFSVLRFGCSSSGRNLHRRP